MVLNSANIHDTKKDSGVDFMCPKCNQRLLRTVVNHGEKEVSCGGCKEKLIIALDFYVQLKSEVDLFKR